MHEYCVNTLKSKALDAHIVHRMGCGYIRLTRKTYDLGPHVVPGSAVEMAEMLGFSPASPCKTCCK